MIEAYVIAVWLVLSLCAGATVREWGYKSEETAFVFFAWPVYVLLALALGILILTALTYFRISDWIGGK